MVYFVCLLDWPQSTQNKHFIWICLWGVFIWIGGFSKFPPPMRVGIIEPPEGLGRTRGRGNLPLLLPACLIEWRDFFSSFLAHGLGFKSLVFSFVRCLSKIFYIFTGLFYWFIKFLGVLISVLQRISSRFWLAF